MVLELITFMGSGHAVPVLDCRRFLLDIAQHFNVSIVDAAQGGNPHFGTGRKTPPRRCARDAIDKVDAARDELTQRRRHWWTLSGLMLRKTAAMIRPGPGHWRRAYLVGVGTDATSNRYMAQTDRRRTGMVFTI